MHGKMRCFQNGCQSTLFVRRGWARLKSNTGAIAGADNFAWYDMRNTYTHTTCNDCVFVEFQKSIDFYCGRRETSNIVVFDDSRTAKCVAVVNTRSRNPYGNVAKFPSVRSAELNSDIFRQRTPSMDCVRTGIRDKYFQKKPFFNSDKSFCYTPLYDHLFLQRFHQTGRFRRLSPFVERAIVSAAENLFQSRVKTTNVLCRGKSANLPVRLKVTRAVW